MLKVHPVLDMPDTFTWSASSRRYYRNGKPVSDEEMRNVIGATADKAATRVRDFSQDYVDALINHAEWVVRMKQEIRSGIRGMAQLANGGKLDRRTIGLLAAAVKAQYKFLNNFSLQIENGDVKLGPGMIYRAGMYMDNLRSQYQNFVRDGERRAGMRYERLILGVAHHCIGCLEDSLRGWVAVGTLRPIGGRNCAGGCRCHFAFAVNPPLRLLSGVVSA